MPKSKEIDEGEGLRGRKTSNYYWPSQGGTFIAVSFVLCSVLFSF